jgi:hypothetical protein
LEVQVHGLTGEVRELNKKIDDLLALRNKGAGAFWLGTTLFGTTLIGLLAVVFDWFKS